MEVFLLTCYIKGFLSGKKVVKYSKELDSMNIAIEAKLNKQINII